MTKYNLISFIGIFGLLGFAWLISADRRRMNWRAIGWGLGLQFTFALFVFVFPVGNSFFAFMNKAVVKVFGAAHEKGIMFVFGRLALEPGAQNALGESSISQFPILAFQAFPIVIFVAAFMSVLYHLGIMQRIIRLFAWVFSTLMRVSGAEALCASSNIFVGVESALTVKPYIERMTRSELCLVLTAGMATVASTVLAIYVSFLHKVFPGIAGHLVSASILSAPAALVMAKIVLPESGQPETLGVAADVYHEKEGSLFEAVISGANTGMKLMLGIIALLIAVLGLMGVLDLFIGYAGGMTGIDIDWSMKGLLGFLASPFVYLLGVPAEDAWEVSKIIGMRAVETEVPGYIRLSMLLEQGAITQRSAIITTYALCGFAHVASLAIFVGGISALAPSRAGDLAKVGGRALIAATLACLLTACVAGVFTTDSSFLLGG